MLRTGISRKRVSKGWNWMHRKSVNSPSLKQGAPTLWLNVQFMAMFPLAALLLAFALPSFAQSATAPMPENAHPKSYGDGWECDVSYRIEGDLCVAIVVPQHGYATNRTYGKGWYC